ncbi:MAG: molecular chaperone HtpG [Deltaproteobacteria bacterium]|nr:MAG: molecular chaperone HtpG [Deltaproteobacteria bacterium]
MSATEHGFQAEVQQLLDLMIHSVYSDREVFLRELVSNAADALDKARFMSLTRPELLPAGSSDPGVRITVDPDAKTLTIEDDGIGMTRDEVVQYLGTIAHSGTKSFVEKLRASKEAEEGAPELIGQFGIGFYSAFMVARQVDVETRSAEPDAEPVRWVSEGAGTYTLDQGEREHRGTSITLHLRSDADEYADASRLSSIVERYSNFVTWPILVDEEQANEGKALWRQRPAEVTDEQSAAFYKSISGDWSDPALTIHFKVDTPIQYSAMLFIPEQRPWDLFTPNVDRGPRLYARNVLITEHAKGLLPDWLRFVRGVVDSEDISLNVSREMVQQTPILQKIGTALVKRVIKELGRLAGREGDSEEAQADRDRYAKIWRNFGLLLKEGYYHSGPDLRDRVLPLLRFNARSHEGPDGLISLADYKQAMPEGQDKIWFITAPDRDTALQSPALEAFARKGYDVLLLTDPVDEWLVTVLEEFDGTPVQSVARGEVDLGDDDEDDAERADLSGLLPFMKTLFDGQVVDVRGSSRLTDSAAVLVDADDGISSNLERILKQANQAVPTSRRVLEVNPKHPLIQHLAALHERGEDQVVEPLTRLLLDEARLLDGSLDEPAAMGRRVQDLLQQVAARAAQV